MNGLGDTISVLGYRVARLSLEEAAGWTLLRCRAGEPPVLVVTLNPEIIVRARQDSRLEAAVQSAELTVADGVGVVWAAKRAGAVLPGRVPGVELATRVLELGGPQLKVFYLGAKPGVAERAAARASELWGTSTAGVRHGYFDHLREGSKVAAEIRASGADLVLAGLGEAQEVFLHEHRKELGAGVLIGVGGTLDVLAGEAARTPGWTRRLGVEWLWRVGLDPARWHRFPRLLGFARLVLSESGRVRRS